MDETSTRPMDDTLSTWLSTYGLITVERIVATLGLHLNHDELIQAIHDKTTIHYHVLRVPLQTILNGIILNQAVDYREFAQKIFIDYLLSGAANETEAASAQGADAREAIEQERLRLIAMGDAFDLQEFEHHALIGESQKKLIALSKALLSTPADLTPVDHHTINDQMAAYIDRSQAQNVMLRQYRTQFYDLILRLKGLIAALPGYRPDATKIMEHRELLQFDPTIGEA